MAHNEIVALDPTSGPLDRKDARAFPERPETLNGAVVGLVANGLGEGQKMMDALYDELNKEAEILGSVRENFLEKISAREIFLKDLGSLGKIF